MSINEKCSYAHFFLVVYSYQKNILFKINHLVYIYWTDTPYNNRFSYIPSTFQSPFQQQQTTITTDEVLWQRGILRWSYSPAISWESPDGGDSQCVCWWNDPKQIARSILHSQSVDQVKIRTSGNELALDKMKERKPKHYKTLQKHTMMQVSVKMRIFAD